MTDRPGDRTSGLPPDPAACGADDPHCITCGDEGIPVTVVSRTDDTAICVDADHIEHEVAIDLLGSVGAGDQLLIHAGVAIAHLEVAR